MPHILLTPIEYLLRFHCDVVVVAVNFPHCMHFQLRVVFILAAGGGYGGNSVRHANYGHVQSTSEGHAKKNIHRMKFEIK